MVKFFLLLMISLFSTETSELENKKTASEFFWKFHRRLHTDNATASKRNLHEGLMVISSAENLHESYLLSLKNMEKMTIE